MTTILLIGAASAMAVCTLLVKARVFKPKKAEKREKAEIVKQLLALSERENTIQGISRPPSVSQNPSPRRRAAAGRSAVTH